MSRRRLLLGAGKAFVLPTFTGSYAIHGNTSKGYIELFSSGTLTLSASIYDVYLLGGGAKAQNGGGDAANGSGGGGGGYTINTYSISLFEEYTVNIGASLGNTSAFGEIALAGKTGTTQTSGGDGGSGGARFNGNSSDSLKSQGGTDGGNGGLASSYDGVGQGTTTKPFSGDSAEFNTPYGAGGGGGGMRNKGNQQYPGGVGGSYGGGDGACNTSASTLNGTNGTANTGGGGGGAGRNFISTESVPVGSGGSGGSGLVIVRWGYAA